MAGTAVRLEGIRKLYGDAVAVEEVSLTIESGELFFLLGPSGCGKTTLLRMIAGFVEPTAGRIAFGDRDVTRLAPNARETGMVFQSYALWPHMTVADNVAYGLVVRKVPAEARRARVARALAAVRMDEYAERRPNQLSGGQQQRVALARALVVEPSVLLLDEPLSNLDAKLRLEMRREIRQLCKSTGITTIYVTHDQDEALSMADRVAVLDRGRVAQVGGPRALYARPASRFVASFLGETNLLEGTLVAGGAAAAPTERSVQANEDMPVRVTLSSGQVISGVAPSAAWTDRSVNAGQTAVRCSIRLEALRLEPVAGPAEAGRAGLELEGTCVEHEFHGRHAQHRVEIEGLGVLRVVEQNPGPFSDPGSRVRVRAKPEDVVVMPA